MILNHKKTIVFTDLDGTLLDHDTYEFKAAQNALQVLKRKGIPIIICTSKTFWEVVELKKKLKNYHPFICENGSVIAIPNEYFKNTDIENAGYEKIKEFLMTRLGGKRESILRILHQIRKKNNFFFTGFEDMSVSQLCDVTGLDTTQAKRASQRMSTEPILWQDTDAAWQKFIITLKQNHLAWVQGGRFISISKPFDKKDGINALSDLFQKEWQQDLYFIGLGDSPNDQGMLELMDTAVIIHSNRSNDIVLKQPKKIIRTKKKGPAGWQEAINTIFNHHLEHT